LKAPGESQNLRMIHPICNSSVNTPQESAGERFEDVKHKSAIYAKRTLTKSKSSVPNGEEPCHSDPLFKTHLFPLGMQRTLWQTNIAMENGPLEDVFTRENGDIPLLCQFAGVYILPMVCF